MWQKIGYSCALLVTACLSRRDIRTKTISVKGLLISTAAACFFVLIRKNMTEYYALPGMLPGMMLILLAKATGEKIGYGDGAVVILLGLFCGMIFTVFTVGVAFLISGIYALILLGKGRKDTMPFLPFLLAAMEVLWLYE